MKKFVQFAFITATLIIGISILSNSNGPSTDASGSPFSVTNACAGCHSSGGTYSPNSGITITGLPSNYYPGTTYNITYSLNNPTNKNGFQLVALRASNNSQAGSWTTGTGTKTINQGGRSYIEHNSGSSTGSWTFTWTAPGTNVGTVDFYGAGNATNNNSSTSGDNVYTTSMSISGLPLISVSENITPETCASSCNGSIDVNISGGTGGNYTSTWSNSASFTSSSYTMNNLCAGTYTVTITDGDGNSEVNSYTIGTQTNLQATTNTTGSPCAAGSGSASISVSGGASPYSYSWDNGDTTAMINNLFPGSYAVTVTDDNGCSFDTVLNVNSTGSGLQANFTENNPSCGNADGSLIITPSNGTAPFSYLWSNNMSGDSIGGLTAGSYSVTITDDNGCTQVFSTSLSDIGAPTLTSDAEIDITCNGGSDGEIDLSISGGTAPFNVSWIGPNGFTGSDSTLSGLIAGDYFVTITDANGCNSSDSFSLSEPNAPLQLQLDSLLDATNGNCNGYIEVSATGDNSSSGMSYQWNNPATVTSPINDNLCPGTYTVTGTDAAGCMDTASYEIQDLSTGITERQKDQFKIYPNPANDYVYIENNSGLGVVKLTNVAGQVVKEIELTDYRTKVSLQDLEQGIYFIGNDALIIN